VWRTIGTKKKEDISTYKMSKGPRGGPLPRQTWQWNKNKNNRKKNEEKSGDSGDTVSSAYTQLDMVKLAHKIAWECRQL